MPVVRQKTVDGRTYKLHKDKTNRSGYENEYFVTENGSIVDDPVYSRRDGDRQFQETIDAVERAAESESGNDMFSFGVGDPSDVQIPGLTDTGDDDSDDGNPWGFF